MRKYSRFPRSSSDTHNLHTFYQLVCKPNAHIYYCSHTSTRIERRVCIVMRNKKLYYIAVVGKKQVLKLKDSAWSIKQFCFHEKHFEGDSNLSKDKFLSYTHEKLKSVPTVSTIDFASIC